MNIIFFGTTDTGRHCLEKMLKANLPVKGIITGFPDFEVSYSKSKVSNCRYSSFDDLEKQYGIPVIYYSRKFDEDMIQKISSWSPMLFVVIGWYHIIPMKICQLAEKGVIGVHWSLLPKYRGGSPLVWAMINGEKETGASLFYFDAKIDAGPVIAQKSVRINKDDNVAQLIDNLNMISGDLVVEKIPQILAGQTVAWEQDEALATYYSPRLPNDGKINWKWGARKIYNFIRAQTLPYPCAFTKYNNQKISIVSASDRPVNGRHVRVLCGDGNWLWLKKILVAEEGKIRDAFSYFQSEIIDFQ